MQPSAEFVYGTPELGLIRRLATVTPRQRLQVGSSQRADQRVPVGQATGALPVVPSTPVTRAAWLDRSTNTVS
jgi:hypothetical protein